MPQQSEVNGKLERAVQLHRQGATSEAQSLYNDILQNDPTHSAALCYLGLIKYAQGRYGEAHEFISRACENDTDSAWKYSNLGIVLQALGRLNEALSTYDKALEIAPKNVDALINRGLALFSLGRSEEAVASFNQALAVKPDHAEALNNRGVALLDLKRFEEALTSYDMALAARPDYPEALGNRGNALLGLARFEEAVASCDSALTARPGYAEAFNVRCAALLGLKRLDEALASCDKALEIRPDYAEALSNRSIALLGLKRFEEALASCTKALEIRPDHVEALSNRSIALLELKRFEEALASCVKALEIRPDYAEALNNHSAALLGLKRFEEAITSCNRTLAFVPDYAEAFNNRAAALKALGRTEEALTSYEQAMAIKPDADFGWNTALVLLLLGDFETGWQKYEWRWLTKRYSPRKFPRPLWKGEELGGRAILLYSEQGLGDTLQFARYAPLVAAHGGRVILEVQPALARLLTGIKGATQVNATGTPLPDFDLCCPLLSLPGCFGTTLATIPAEPAYLAADPLLSRQWAEAIGDEPGLKVGVVWAGNPNKVNDDNRSMALDQLGPLLEVPGIRWISLQGGDGAADIKRLPVGSIIDLSLQLMDLAETAAVMANLDLVISVDTAFAHLAGALGRPVWVLLPFAPDWRWLLHREDSPWYPSMRLFRQPLPGDWETVISKMVLSEIRNWTLSHQPINAAI